MKSLIKLLKIAKRRSIWTGLVTFQFYYKIKSYIVFQTHQAGLAFQRLAELSLADAG